MSSHGRAHPPNLRDHPTWPRLRALVLARTGRDLAEYRATTLQRRLRAQMTRRGVSSYGAYVKLLEEDASEACALLEQLSIKASQFFRDPVGFARIAEELFVGRRLADPPLRIWSAGCGRGEEAYSLAIAAFDAGVPRFSILATDVDGGAIDTARRGVFPRKALAALDARVLDAWFETDPAARPRTLTVKPALRSVITFRTHDVLTGEAPDPRPFDVILCRNVLIYFERPGQTRVQRLLRRCLAPRGILWLGETEVLLPELHGDFVALDADGRVFRLR